jgi:hypothetical protein
VRQTEKHVGHACLPSEKRSRTHMAVNPPWVGTNPYASFNIV